jgi:predicted phosphoribosyltransferase
MKPSRITVAAPVVAPTDAFARLRKQAQGLVLQMDAA